MPKKIDEARLFNAAMRLWVERGYSGTTTKLIAERAGVNEATLFRRYGGKAELVTAAICEPLRSAPLRKVKATDDLNADLLCIVEAYQETHRQIGAVIPLLLIEASRHPELRPALEVTRENIGFLTRVIEHHQASGALQKEEPLVSLTRLLGPLFALGLFHGAGSATPPLDPERHVRAFLHGQASRS